MEHDLTEQLVRYLTNKGVKVELVGLDSNIISRQPHSSNIDEAMNEVYETACNYEIFKLMYFGSLVFKSDNGTYEKFHVRYSK